MRAYAQSSVVLIVSAQVLIILGLTGCQPSETKPSSLPTDLKKEDDDHGHSHGPSYKPETFAKAVAEIKKRLEHIHVDLTGGHLDHVEDEIITLREFIHWLPELAGDTDMAEGEWNQVQAVSREMLKSCDNVDLKIKQGSLTVEDLSDLESQLNKQVLLVPFAVDRPAVSVPLSTKPEKPSSR
ncbi:hypothetical protein Pla110_42010 [Polystyrenella longa]|uniref:Uncharacterized protein n=1 Tax=Polystyrenella longa TaxID=2528007 RepID=A0A518CTD7_9PLAN|nr:hypothetical protein [Polystyrenella longa]QDU82444.1 hypothetical protein Pla110_42010 [Polystyrenella longa]